MPTSILNVIVALNDILINLMSYFFVYFHPSRLFNHNKKKLYFKEPQLLVFLTICIKMWDVKSAVVLLQFVHDRHVCPSIIWTMTRTQGGWTPSWELRIKVRMWPWSSFWGITLFIRSSYIKIPEHKHKLTVYLKYQHEALAHVQTSLYVQSYLTFL